MIILTKLSQIPDWFKLENYSKASQLDAYGWFLQIGARLFLDYIWKDMNIHDNEFLDGEFCESLESIYSDIREHGIIPLSEFVVGVEVSGKNNDCKNHPFIDPFPFYDSSMGIWDPIEVITNKDFYIFDYPDVDEDQMTQYMRSVIQQGNYGESVVEGGEVWLDSPYKPQTNHSVFLGVDLTVSDSLLETKFKKWLLAARKNYPIGKTKITPLTFNKWATWHVLAYWDLMFWSKYENENITNAQLLAILFPTRTVETDRIRKTVKRSMEHAFRVYADLREMAIFEYEKNLEEIS